MKIAFLLIVLAVGVYAIARRRNKKSAEAPKKKRILAVRRAGVIVAYRHEDLPMYNDGMLAPTAGMMVFADCHVPGPTTGTQDDLIQLAEQTGRDLVWEGDYAMFVPYTGGFCTSPQQDAADYGRIILRKEEARTRLQQ